MRHPTVEKRRLAQLQRDENRRNYLGDVLDFMDSLAILTETVRPSYPEGSTALPADAEPPLAPPRFPLDEAAAEAAFEAFLGLFERGVAADEARRVRAALGAGAFTPVEAARAYLASDQGWLERLHAEQGLDATFLARLAELALRPQAVERARAFSVGSERTSERCPVCGSAPDAAFLADRDGTQGARFAVCGFCETEWRLPRVACPQCGNDDPETLGYLHARDDSGVRAAVCDECHTYLITIDARGRLDFAPAVDRAAALPLDVIAQGEGYAPVGSVDVRR